MKLSAVIACYRDAPAVPIMHERLSRMFDEIGADYEIIFVNDGSPDNAREVLAELAGRDPKVVVVNHTRAFGSQSAFTSGMQIATGDAVVLLDGDLQDPPEMIPRFVEQWQEGFDIVYGVRVEREATAFMRRAYKLFYRLFRRLSYVEHPARRGRLRAARSPRRRCVERPARVAPLHQRAARVGRLPPGRRALCAAGADVRRTHQLADQEPRLGAPRDRLVLLRAARSDRLAGAGRRWASRSSRWWRSSILRFTDPSLAPKGFTTLIVGMLFIGGIQLLCLAIIGSYVAHIYEESKHRPPYLVESVLNPPRPAGECSHHGSSGQAPPGRRMGPSMAAALRCRHEREQVRQP